MFCPLCQSEYRDGFTACNDCEVDLLDPFKGLQFSSVLLWKGERQTVFNLVLNTLDAQGIPSHPKEIPNLEPREGRWWIGWLPISPKFEYEVWVLRSDLWVVDPSCRKCHVTLRCEFPLTIGRMPRATTPQRKKLTHRKNRNRQHTRRDSPGSPGTITSKSMT